MQNDHPMSAAELRVRRESLGITGDWLANHLDVSPRTVRHWEQGKYAIPDGVRDEILRLEARTAEIVDSIATLLHEQDAPLLRTFRDDLELSDAAPETRMPAAWHRAVCARISARVPGLSIQYWTDHIRAMREMGEAYGQVGDAAARASAQIREMTARIKAATANSN